MTQKNNTKRVALNEKVVTRRQIRKRITKQAKDKLAKVGNALRQAEIDTKKKEKAEIHS